jgi:hypothetical protein
MIRYFKKLNRWALTISVLLLFSQSYGQIANSVNATINITPPYSFYLNDYYAPGINKLSSTLLLKDLSEPTLDVKLFLRIEGDNGVIIETKPNFNPLNIITLSPGSPVTITGADWTEYFNYNNLNITGTNVAAFTQNGMFPEGFYQVNVTVLEYNTGKAVSNKAFATLPIRLGGIPQVNQPTSNALAPTNPQNIMFQWMLSAPAPDPTKVEYKFFMYEIVPNDVPPLTAFNAGNATQIFESEWITNAFLTYDASAAALIPGKKYAYRVRARDRDAENVFRNDGWSEPYWFAYGYNTNGNIAMIMPDTNFKFHANSLRTFKWAAPDNKQPSQQVRYYLRIVKLTNQIDDLADAIKNKPLFFEHNSNATTNPNDWQVTVDDEFEKSKWYAWQVTAFSGDQEIAKSQIRKFQGPPLINDFRAGDHDVTVLSVDRYDLNNLKGKARVYIDRDRIKYYDIDFDSLKIIRAGNIFVLDQGKIYKESNDLEEIEIPSLTQGLSPANFKPNAVKLDKNALYLRGVFRIPVRLPIDGDVPVIQSDNRWINYNNFRPVGVVKFTSTFDLLDPSNFGILLDTNNNISIGNEGYLVNLYGRVLLPNTTLDKDGQRIAIQFKNMARLDYFEIDADLNDVLLQNYFPVPGVGLEVIPQTYIIDFSANQSPSGFPNNWKGVYVKKYKLKYHQLFDKKEEQLKIVQEFERTIEQLYDATQKNFFNSNGLNFKTDYDFKPMDKLKFNGFFTGKGKLQVNIENGSIQTGNVTGEALIPLLDQINGFPFTVNMSLDGFQVGVLSINLTGREIFFSKNSAEGEVKMTIKRAEFKKDYLELSVDLDYPSIKINVPNMDDFRIYGNNQIGFGKPNGGKAFENHLKGDLFGFTDIFIDTIGAAYMSGNYYCYASSYFNVADDINGPDGPVRGYNFAKVPINAEQFDMVNDYTNVPTIRIPASAATTPPAETRIIESAYVKVQNSLCELEGSLEMVKNDPDWGNCMKGRLSGKVKMPSEIELGASIIVGRSPQKVEYWFFDAFVKDNGIGVPLIPGVVNIVALEGKFFKNMSPKINSDNTVTIAIDPTTKFGAGVYAQLIDAVQTGRIFKTDLALEVTVRENDFDIFFKGEATFLNLMGRSPVAPPALNAITQDAAMQALDAAANEVNKQSFTIGSWTFRPDIKPSVPRGALSATSGSTSLKFGVELAATSPLAFVDYNSSDWDIGLGADFTTYAFRFNLDKKTGTKFGLGISYLPNDSSSVRFSYDNKIDLYGMVNMKQKSAAFTFGYESGRYSLRANAIQKSAFVEIRPNSRMLFKAAANATTYSGSFDMKIDENEFGMAMQNQGKQASVYFNNNFAADYNSEARTGKVLFNINNFKLLTQATSTGGLINIESGNVKFLTSLNTQQKSGELGVQIGENKSYKFALNTEQGSGFININHDGTLFKIGAGDTPGNGYLEFANSSVELKTQANLQTKSGSFLLKTGGVDINTYLRSDSVMLSTLISGTTFRLGAAKSGAGLLEYSKGADRVLLQGSTSGQGRFLLTTSSILLDLSANKANGSGNFRFKNNNSDSINLNVDRALSSASLATKFGSTSFFANYQTSGQGAIGLITGNKTFTMSGSAQGMGSILYEEPNTLVNLAADIPNQKGRVRMRFTNDSVAGYFNETPGIASLDAKFGNNILRAYGNTNTLQGNAFLKIGSFELAAFLNPSGSNSVKYEGTNQLVYVEGNKTTGSGFFRYKNNNDTIRLAADRTAGTADFNAFVSNKTFNAGYNQAGFGNVYFNDGTRAIGLQGNVSGSGNILYQEGNTLLNLGANLNTSQAFARLRLNNDSISGAYNVEPGVARINAAFGNNSFEAMGNMNNNTGNVAVHVGGSSLVGQINPSGDNRVMFSNTGFLIDVGANKTSGSGLLRYRNSGDTLRMDVNRTSGYANFNSYFAGKTFNAGYNQAGFGNVFFNDGTRIISLEGNVSGSGSILYNETNSTILGVGANTQNQSGFLRFKLGSDSISGNYNIEPDIAQVNAAFGNNRFRARGNKSTNQAQLALNISDNEFIADINPSGFNSVLFRKPNFVIGVTGNKTSGSGSMRFVNALDTFNISVDRTAGTANFASLISNKSFGANYNQAGFGNIYFKDGNREIGLEGNGNGSGSILYQESSTLVNLAADATTQKAKMRFRLNNDSISARYNEEANTAQLNAAFGNDYFNAKGNFSSGVGQVNLNIGGNALKADINPTGMNEIEYQNSSFLLGVRGNKQSGSGMLRMRNNNDTVRVEVDRTAGTAAFNSYISNKTFLANYDAQGAGNIYYNSGSSVIGLSGNGSGSGSILYNEGANLFNIAANIPNQNGLLRLKLGNDSISGAYNIEPGIARMVASFGSNQFSAVGNKNTNFGKVILNISGTMVSGETNQDGTNEVKFSNSSTLFNVRANKNSGSGFLRLGINTDTLRLDVDRSQNSASLATFFGGKTFRGAYNGAGTGNVYFTDNQRTVSLEGNATGSGSILFADQTQLFNVAADKQANKGLLRFKINGDSIAARYNDQPGIAQLDAAFGQDYFSAKGNLNTNSGEVKLKAGSNQLAANINPSGYNQIQFNNNNYLFGISGNKQTGSGSLRVKSGQDSINLQVDRLAGFANYTSIIGNKILSGGYNTQGIGNIYYNDGTRTIGLAGNTSGSGSILYQEASTLVNVGANTTAQNGFLRLKLNNDSISGHYNLQPNEARITAAFGNDFFDIAGNTSTNTGSLQLKIGANELFGTINPSGNNQVRFSQNNFLIDVTGNRTSGSGAFRFKNNLDTINLVVDRTVGTANFASFIGNKLFSAGYNQAGFGNVHFSDATRLIHLEGNVNGQGNILYNEGNNIVLGVGANATASNGYLRFKLNNDSIGGAYNLEPGIARMAAAMGGNNFYARGNKNTGEAELKLKVNTDEVQAAFNPSGNNAISFTKPNFLIGVSGNKTSGSGNFRFLNNADSLNLQVDRTAGTASFASIISNKQFIAGYNQAGYGNVFFKDGPREIGLAGNSNGSGDILYKDATVLFNVAADAQSNKGLLRVKLNSDSIHARINQDPNVAELNASFGGNTFSASGNTASGTGNLAVNISGNALAATINPSGMNEVSFSTPTFLTSVRGNKTTGSGLLRFRNNADSLRVSADRGQGTAALNAFFAGKTFMADYNNNQGSIFYNNGNFAIGLAGSGNGSGAILFTEAANLFQVAANASAQSALLRLKLGNDSISGAYNQEPGIARLAANFSGNTFFATGNKNSGYGKLSLNISGNTLLAETNPNGNNEMRFGNATSLFHVNANKTSGSGFLRIRNNNDTIRVEADRTANTAALHAYAAGKTFKGAYDAQGIGSVFYNDGTRTLGLRGNGTSIAGIYYAESNFLFNILGNNDDKSGLFRLKISGDSLHTKFNQTTGKLDFTAAIADYRLQFDLNKTGNGMLKFKNNAIDLYGHVAQNGDKTGYFKTSNLTLRASAIGNLSAGAIILNNDSLAGKVNSQNSTGELAASAGSFQFLGNVDDNKAQLKIKLMQNVLQLENEQNNIGKISFVTNTGNFLASGNKQTGNFETKIGIGTDSISADIVGMQSAKGRVKIGNNLIRFNAEEQNKLFAEFQNNDINLNVFAATSGKNGFLINKGSNRIYLEASEAANGKEGILSFKMGNDSARLEMNINNQYALKTAIGNLNFESSFNTSGDKRVKFQHPDISIEANELNAVKEIKVERTGFSAYASTQKKVDLTIGSNTVVFDCRNDSTKLIYNGQLYLVTPEVVVNVANYQIKATYNGADKKLEVTSGPIGTLTLAYQQDNTLKAKVVKSGVDVELFKASNGIGVYFMGDKHIKYLEGKLDYKFGSGFDVNTNDGKVNINYQGIAATFKNYNDFSASYGDAQIKMMQDSLYVKYQSKSAAVSKNKNLSIVYASDKYLKYNHNQSVAFKYEDAKVELVKDQKLEAAYQNRKLNLTNDGGEITWDDKKMSYNKAQKQLEIKYANDKQLQVSPQNLNVTWENMGLALSKDSIQIDQNNNTLKLKKEYAKLAVEGKSVEQFNLNRVKLTYDQNKVVDISENGFTGTWDNATVNYQVNQSLSATYNNQNFTVNNNYLNLADGNNRITYQFTKQLNLKLGNDSLQLDQNAVKAVYANYKLGFDKNTGASYEDGTNEIVLQPTYSKIASSGKSIELFENKRVKAVYESDKYADISETAIDGKWGDLQAQYGNNQPLKIIYGQRNFTLSNQYLNIADNDNRITYQFTKQINARFGNDSVQIDQNAVSAVYSNYKFGFDKTKGAHYEDGTNEVVIEPTYAKVSNTGKSIELFENNRIKAVYDADRYADVSKDNVDAKWNDLQALYGSNQPLKLIYGQQNFTLSNQYLNLAYNNNRITYYFTKQINVKFGNDSVQLDQNAVSALYSNYKFGFDKTKGAFYEDGTNEVVLEANYAKIASGTKQVELFENKRAKIFYDNNRFADISETAIDAKWDDLQAQYGNNQPLKLIYGQRNFTLSDQYLSIADNNNRLTYYMTKQINARFGNDSVQVDQNAVSAVYSNYKFGFDKTKGAFYEDGTNEVILEPQYGKIASGGKSIELFENKRVKVYYDADKYADVSQTAINGKWGNLEAEYGNNLPLRIAYGQNNLTLSNQYLNIADNNNRLTYYFTKQLNIKFGTDSVQLDENAVKAVYSNYKFGFDKTKGAFYEDGNNELVLEPTYAKIASSGKSIELFENKRIKVLYAIDKYVDVSATAIDAKWDDASAEYGTNLPLKIAYGTRSFVLTGQYLSLSDNSNRITYYHTKQLNFKYGSDSVQIDQNAVKASFANYKLGFDKTQGAYYEDGTNEIVLSPTYSKVQSGTKSVELFESKRVKINYESDKYADLSQTAINGKWGDLEAQYGNSLPLKIIYGQRSFTLSNQYLNIADNNNRLTYLFTKQLNIKFGNDSVQIDQNSVAANYSNYKFGFDKAKGAFYEDGTNEVVIEPAYAKVATGNKSIELFENKRIKMVYDTDKYADFSQTNVDAKWGQLEGKYGQGQPLSITYGQNNFTLSNQYLNIADNSNRVTYYFTKQLNIKYGNDSIQLDQNAVIARYSNYIFGFDKTKGAYYEDGSNEVVLEPTYAKIAASGKSIELFENKRVKVNYNQDKYADISATQIDAKWGDLSAEYGTNQPFKIAYGQRNFTLSNQYLNIADNNNRLTYYFTKQLNVKYANDSIQLDENAVNAAFGDYKFGFDKTKGAYYEDGTNEVVLEPTYAKVMRNGKSIELFNNNRVKVNYDQNKYADISQAVISAKWDDIEATYGNSQPLKIIYGQRNFTLSNQYLNIADNNNRLTYYFTKQLNVKYGNDSIQLDQNAVRAQFSNYKFGFDKTVGAYYDDGSNEVIIDNALLKITASGKSIELINNNRVKAYYDQNRYVDISQTMVDAKWDDVSASYGNNQPLTVAYKQKVLKLNNQYLQIAEGNNRLSYSFDKKLSVVYGSDSVYISPTLFAGKYDKYGFNVNTAGSAWMTDGEGYLRISDTIQIERSGHFFEYLVNKNQIAYRKGTEMSIWGSPEDVGFKRNLVEVTIGKKDGLKYYDGTNIFQFGDDLMLSVENGEYQLGIKDLKTNNRSFFAKKGDVEVGYNKNLGFVGKYQTHELTFGGQQRYFGLKTGPLETYVEQGAIYFDYDDLGLVGGGDYIGGLKYKGQTMAIKKSGALEMTDNGKGFEVDDKGNITIINGTQRFIAGGNEPIRFVDAGENSNSPNDGGFKFKVAGMDFEAKPSAGNNVILTTNAYSIADIEVASQGQGQMYCKVTRNGTHYGTLYKNLYTWGLALGNETPDMSGPKPPVPVQMTGPSNIGHITHNSPSVIQAVLTAGYSSKTKSFFLSGAATGTKPLLCMDNVNFEARFNGAPKSGEPQFLVKVADETPESKWAAIRPFCIPMGPSGFFYLDDKRLAAGVKVGFQFKGGTGWITVIPGILAASIDVDFGYYLKGIAKLHYNPRFQLNELTVEASAWARVDACGKLIITGSRGCINLASLKMTGRLSAQFDDNAKRVSGSLEACIGILGKEFCQDVNVTFNF